jgi:DNA/RNA endonuclease G (NUC1)
MLIDDKSEIISPSQLFGNDRSLSFHRGHLTANADFITLYQRRASFYYSNIAPQISSTNYGNFKIVEDFVRKFVAVGHFDVYSGIHGTMKVIFHSSSKNNNKSPKNNGKLLNIDIFTCRSRSSTKKTTK